MRAETARSIFSTMLTTTYIEKAKQELTELERLAEIGRATEKWFDNDGSLYDTENDVEIHSSNSLLDWAKED